MAKSKNNPAPADYQVGRGKPPQSTRFKPGQSGNPSGRKKGSRNVKTVIQSALEEEVVIIENGKKRSLTFLEALVKRMLQDALKGNLPAARDLLDRYERYENSEPEQVRELPETDRAILNRILGLGPTVGSPEPVMDYEANGDGDE
jgi:hypothetical protein